MHLAATGTSAVGLRAAAAVFHQRDYTIFWLGSFVSNIGLWMQNITIPLVVLELTDRPAMVGVAAFAQLLPALVLGPLSGAIADRFPRRSVLLVTQTSMAVPALGLWVLWQSGNATVGRIILLAALVGVASALNLASWAAYVSDLASPATLLGAVSLNSAQFNAARAVGPALGGLVIGAWGPGTVFLLNAASYGAVIGALLAIATPGSPSGRGRSLRFMWHDTLSSYRAVRAHPGLGAAIGGAVVVGFVGTPIVQLTSVFAKEVYRVGPTRYSLLPAALGFGAVLGGAATAAWGSRIARGDLAVVALLAYGGALAAMGVVTHYPVGVVMLFVAGMGYVAVLAALNTTVQSLADEAHRGKTISLYMMCLTGGTPFGALAEGVAADAFGAPITMVVAGAVLLAAGGVLWSRQPVREAMEGAVPLVRQCEERGVDDRLG